MVQLRLKRASDRELLRLARQLLAVLPVPLLINDRLDLALLSGAAGVHLGSDDIPPDLARRITPPGFLIGASVGSQTEAERGQSADYWGVGPLHGTSTKADAGKAIGWEGVSRIMPLRNEVIPVVVIGGVKPEDCAEARLRGLAGVAVVSGILGQEDPEQAAQSYSRRL